MGARRNLYMDLEDLFSADAFGIWTNVRRKLSAFKLPTAIY